MSKVRAFQILLGILISLSCSSIADVKLPSIISDNMVLQQNCEVNFWGSADPGETIYISPGWSRDNVTVLSMAVANDKGKWFTTFRTPQAGGPYDIRIKGNNNLVIKNVLIGEIWLCSGQSNMEMPMKGWEKQPVYGADEDIKNADNSSIRFFTVPKRTADKPQTDVNSQWIECTQQTVKDFSAVGYYFGREINRKTAFPVGLIFSAWGGTVAEAWTREEFIENDDELSVIIGVYKKLYSDWEKTATMAEKENKPKPQLPFRANAWDKTSVLYNAMIAPLLNMTIKGVIWYQGESNAQRAYQYRQLLPTMIFNWRCDFNNFEMPFYFVQIAGYVEHSPGTEVTIYKGKPRESDWAELREAQFMTSSLKNTGMAVAIDLGEANNVHLAKKNDVGNRLALWALAKNYGKDIEYSGPLYSGYCIEGDRIRVFFSHADDGLFAKDGRLKGFTVSGKDRKFVWADAQIDGRTVLVSSHDTKEPVAVRYAWDIYPECNLYNTRGLPASPFRTDHWQGVTYNNK